MSIRTKLSEIRMESWLITGGWILAILGIVVWLSVTSVDALRNLLRHSQFWVLETQFLLLLILSVINVPALVRSLGVRWRDLRWPVAASVLAFTLATFVAPKTSRIYYDEQIYQGIGQNLADLHLAQMCNDGTVEYGQLTCRIGEYNKEPYAYPYLLSVAYRFIGAHEAVAFALNPLIAAGLVWVVFLATATLTSSFQAGGYAALVMALVPEQLRWAHTAAAEPSAALATAFALLSALAFVRLRSTQSLMWMIVASVFAMEFRPECLLVAALVAAVCLLYAPEEFTQRRLWSLCLVGLLLSAGHIGHLQAVRFETWGAAGTRLSPMFILPNLRVNGWFYLADARFPVAYSFLALSAVFAWRQRRALAICLLYFLLFWGVFLLFYAGSYNYGADDRFSLMSYPPLAILAGIGTWTLAERLKRADWLLERADRLVAAALVVQFLWYVPFVRAVGEEAWAARADVAFARRVAMDLPANSIVLTHNPHMFHVWGLNAAQLSLVSRDADYAKRFAARYAGGVFVHWNFWCTVPDPIQQGFCTAALSQFPHTLIQDSRERHYRFAMYRLEVSTSDQLPRSH